MGMFKRYFKSFTHAISGIVHALINDFGFRKQFYGMGVVIVVSLVLLWPVTSTEFLFVTLAYALVLITELQNTALENALDKLHPELHKAIGLSKDMAAGAVLLAGLFLLLVIASLFLSRFLS